MADTDVRKVPGIVAAVRETYNSGVTRPLEWRFQQLRCLHRLIDENTSAIVAAMHQDLRRPETEAVLAECVDVLGQILYFEKNLPKLVKNQKLPTPLHQKPLAHEVRRDPLGVVTVIAPWNFPIALLFSPLASVLAAGNTCVVKPSEVSATCSRLISELVPKYFDPKVVGVVTGGVPQTTALLAEKVDHILYTGGGGVATIVLEAAAKHLTPVTLELGGKCPTYIDQSANIQVAARRTVMGKNLNAGQVCIAPDHIFIHAKVQEAFLEHLKTEHERLYPGDEQKNPDKSRIVNDRHFQRVCALMEGHGGQVVMGGNKDAQDRFLEFTVITNPSRESALMREEIFGPVLPVITVNSVEEAISQCRGKPIPLAAYVHERDAAVREKWLTEVASGGACVNDSLYHIVNNEGGLSGRGESGMGYTRGRPGFETFSHRKIVGFQPPNFDPLAKYPPYNGVPEFLKNIVMGKTPFWVTLACWAVVGGAASALALFASKHVSVNFSISFH